MHNQNTTTVVEWGVYPLSRKASKWMVLITRDGADDSLANGRRIDMKKMDCSPTRPSHFPPPILTPQIREPGKVGDVCVFFWASRNYFSLLMYFAGCAQRTEGSTSSRMSDGVSAVRISAYPSYANKSCVAVVILFAAYAVNGPFVVADPISPNEGGQLRLPYLLLPTHALRPLADKSLFIFGEWCDEEERRRRHADHSNRRSAALIARTCPASHWSHAAQPRRLVMRRRAAQRPLAVGTVQRTEHRDILDEHDYPIAALSTAAAVPKNGWAAVAVSFPFPSMLNAAERLAATDASALAASIALSTRAMVLLLRVTCCDGPFDPAATAAEACTMTTPDLVLNSEGSSITRLNVRRPPGSGPTPPPVNGSDVGDDEGWHLEIDLGASLSAEASTLLIACQRCRGPIDPNSYSPRDVCWLKHNGPRPPQCMVAAACGAHPIAPHDDFLRQDRSVIGRSASFHALQTIINSSNVTSAVPAVPPAAIMTSCKALSLVRDEHCALSLTLVLTVASLAVLVMVGEFVVGHQTHKAVLEVQHCAWQKRMV